MTSPFLGELLGTMTMILFGDGVVAAVLLNHSKAQNAGWMVITGGWAFAVLCGVYVALAAGSPDAHLNPAVTLFFAVTTGNWDKLLPYAVAQLTGAFLGAALVWLHYFPHWEKTESQDLKRAVFCTGPAIRNIWTNCVSEIIATVALLVVIAAIASKAVGGASGMAPGIGPYMVAMLVWGVGLSLGGTTGYAINPARDLGPRIAHAILPIAGKGHSDWGYALIPVLAPLAGAVLAGSAVQVIGIH